MYKYINMWKSRNNSNILRLDPSIYSNKEDAYKGYLEMKSVTEWEYSRTLKIRHEDSMVPEDIIGYSVDISKTTNEADKSIMADMGKIKSYTDTHFKLK